MINFITKNISYRLNDGNVNLKSLENAKELIYDESYYNFILNEANGAYLFSNSVQIYSYSSDPLYHSIAYVNKVLKDEYGNMMNGIYSFGQDIFANQFVFSKNGIELLNIETGDRELLASNFISFQEVLANEVDYLSGRKYTTIVEQEVLLDHRICPKKPFIIGGNYSADNLYSLIFPEYLKVNANIARQVHNLPDGADIILKSTE